MKTNTYTLTHACMPTYTNPKTHFLNTIYLSLIYGQNSRWNNLHDSSFSLHALIPKSYSTSITSLKNIYFSMVFLHCQHVEVNIMNLPSTWKYFTMLPFSRPDSCFYAQLLTYFFPVCWLPSLCVLFKCWCCLGCSHAMQSPWLISFITLTTTSMLTTNKSVSLAHFSFPSSVPMFLTACYLLYTIWSLSRYLKLIMSQMNLLYSPLYELASPTEFPV